MSYANILKALCIFKPKLCATLRSAIQLPSAFRLRISFPTTKERESATKGVALALLLAGLHPATK